MLLDVFSTVRKTKLKVVNSDPYPVNWGKNSPPPDLNLYTVLEQELTPSFNYPSCNKRVLSPYSDKEKLGKEITEKTKGITHCVTNSVYFINAINKGALLAAFTFSDEFEKCTSSVVSLFEEYIKVEDDQNSFTVVPQLSLTRAFESIVVAELMSKVSKIDKKEEVTIDELKEKAYIYSKNSMLSTIVNNEFYSIEKHITSNSSNWEPLSNYYKSNEYSPDPDSRTFFAHAGLPVIFLEVNPGEKKLRYKEEVKEKKLRSFLKERE